MLHIYVWTHVHYIKIKHGDTLVGIFHLTCLDLTCVVAWIDHSSAMQTAQNFLGVSLLLWLHAVYTFIPCIVSSTCSDTEHQIQGTQGYFFCDRTRLGYNTPPASARRHILAQFFTTLGSIQECSGCTYLWMTNCHEVVQLQHLRIIWLYMQRTLSSVSLPWSTMECVAKDPDVIFPSTNIQYVKIKHGIHTVWFCPFLVKVTTSTVCQMHRLVWWQNIK